MPFWAVIGSFAGVVVHTVASPLLHHLGFLPSWQQGMGTINTTIATGIDFWRAFSIGVTMAVTVISFYQLFVTTRRERAQVRQRIVGDAVEYPDVCQHDDCDKPSQVRGYCLTHLGRGDFSIWICVLLFALAALYPIVLAKALFPALVTTGLLVIFFGIAFLYAPLMSVVSARLDGMIGREVSIPYINEAVIFLSGYRGVDIWFVPFPTRNFGGHAEGFRVVELTGMKFTSLLKAEVFMLPIIFAVSLMYWSFLWRLGPIPSPSYPYAQVMWPLKAFDQALFFSSTTYSRTWRAGERIDGRTLQHGEAVWSPSNLQDRSWWYWRVRATADLDVVDPEKRHYGEWSLSGYFFTDFENRGPPDSKPRSQLHIRDENLEALAQVPVPRLSWPAEGEVVHATNPNFLVSVAVAESDSLELQFEVDQIPTFDGDYLQRSSDTPLLFETFWRDLTHTGDSRDNDGDGLYDEEVINQHDDDGDGAVDEDTRHPLDGRKWPIAVFGAAFTFVMYFVMSFFGLPIFLIWGYVQAVNGIPYTLLPQIIACSHASTFGGATASRNGGVTPWFWRSVLVLECP